MHVYEIILFFNFQINNLYVFTRKVRVIITKRSITPDSQHPLQSAPAAAQTQTFPGFPPLPGRECRAGRGAAGERFYCVDVLLNRWRGGAWIQC